MKISFFASRMSSSRIVSEKYPARGEDVAADAIYKRRGERGITSLDASLLNAPDIALAYSALLEAVRERGKLEGNIREAIVCFAWVFIVIIIDFEY